MKVEVNYKKMGNNLKEALVERNISVESYAEAMNITTRLAFEYIDGNRTMPLERIIATSNYLKISLESLISYKIIA